MQLKEKRLIKKERAFFILSFNVMSNFFFVIENDGLKYLWIFIQVVFYSRIKLLLKKENLKFLKAEINSEVLFYYSRQNSIGLIRDLSIDFYSIYNISR